MPICQSSLAGRVLQICAATKVTNVMNRPPLIQHSTENIEKFVFVVLAIAFVTYARFVMLVISDITNYLGIACLTVRKRDANGVWRSAVPMRPSEKRV